MAIAFSDTHAHKLFLLPGFAGGTFWPPLLGVYMLGNNTHRVLLPVPDLWLRQKETKLQT